MDWVRGDEEEQQDGREVDHVLDRVHRKPRPRPWIYIAVVQAVGDAIEWRPVQGAMGDIEAHLVDKWNEEEHRDEPDWVLGERDHWGEAVRVGPEQQHLIRRPDRHAARQCIEHVVIGLVAEREGR